MWKISGFNCGSVLKIVLHVGDATVCMQAVFPKWQRFLISVPYKQSDLQIRVDLQ